MRIHSLLHAMTPSELTYCYISTFQWANMLYVSLSLALSLLLIFSTLFNVISIYRAGLRCAMDENPNNYKFSIHFNHCRKRWSIYVYACVFAHIKKTLHKHTVCGVFEYVCVCLCQMEYYAKVIKIKLSIARSQHFFDLFQLPGWNTSEKNLIPMAVTVRIKEKVSWRKK